MISVQPIQSNEFNKEHIATEQNIKYNSYFESYINRIKNKQLYRKFIPIQRIKSKYPFAKHENNYIQVWCGVDYLGLTSNKEIADEVIRVINIEGVGSGGSRNIGGNSLYHVKLESTLKEIHKKDAAILFNSGYNANLGGISSLGKIIPNLIILSDEENHASIIEGIKKSGCQKFIYKHNDINNLYSILKLLPKKQPKLIIFESIYSMDGSVSPIKQIIQLAKEFNCMTYLDEVHAIGIYGEKGSGMADEIGVSSDIDIIQGTLGKGLGLVGGYLASTELIVDSIRSVASSFIFTVSLPPYISAGAIKSFDLISRSTDLKKKLINNKNYLIKKLDENNIKIISKDSHIISVIIGDSIKCKLISNILLSEHKIYITSVNYPSVPINTDRLRITVTSKHTIEQIDYFVDKLSKTINRVFKG